MEELQRWLDVAPTLRRCVVEFDGSWYVQVRQLSNFADPAVGTARHESLMFAAVSAILDLNKRRTES